MLSSPPYGALCTKYRALIAEMQKRKRPILCYSEFHAKALVRQTITIYISYSLSDECLRTKLRVTENRSLPFLHFCYIYIYIYIYLYICIYIYIYDTYDMALKATFCLCKYIPCIAVKQEAMLCTKVPLGSEAARSSP